MRYGGFVDSAQQCGVVIPCLNEEETIGSLVAEVRNFVPTVLVIDDGSSDATGERAAAAGAEVLRNGQPCGKGASLQQGMQWLWNRGFTWGLCMDGDGQHLPKDIPVLIERAQHSSACMIIGNRMPQARAIPWRRRQVNRWMSWQLSRLCQQSLPDTQCGFRLIKISAWMSLDIRARHFEIESDSLVKFITAKREIEFVPIDVVYRRERSKIRPVIDALRWGRWYWRVRLSKLQEILLKLNVRTQGVRE